MYIYLPEHEHKILTNPPNGSHIVKICQDETFQINSIIHYVKEGLRKNESVIIIAESILRKAVISKLITLDFDVQTLKAQGQIKFFDTEFLLSTFMIDDTLVKKDFQESIEIPMLAMQFKYDKVRTFNDMVEVLWRKGQTHMALSVEDCWNNLFEKRKFSLLCTYFEKSLNSDAYEDSLTSICNYHTHLIH